MILEGKKVLFIYLVFRQVLVSSARRCDDSLWVFPIAANNNLAKPAKSARFQHIPESIHVEHLAWTALIWGIIPMGHHIFYGYIVNHL